MTLGSMLFLHTEKKLAGEKEELDLLMLVSKIKSENIDINGWSLHVRERMEEHRKEDVQKLFSQLRKKFPDWDWAITSDKEKWAATASKATSNGINESIQLLSTLTEENPQTYMIYEVQGKNFTQKTEQFIKEDITGKLSDIFRGNATYFSCVQGQFNGNMNTTLPVAVNNLLNLYEAKEIESLQEENFISTTAYSPLFTEGLTTRNHEINLQLGIRNEGLGAETTFVVGTPIITIEY